MNIFVAKLNYRTSVDQLQDLFSNYGTVNSCKIIMDRETGRSKGYGFVEMSDDDGRAAIEALNEFDFDGQTIVVKESAPRDNNRGGGGRSFRPRNNDGYNRRY